MSIRVDDRLHGRILRLRERIQERTRASGATRVEVSLTDAALQVLDRGVDVLEAEFGVTPEKKGRR